MREFLYPAPVARFIRRKDQLSSLGGNFVVNVMDESFYVFYRKAPETLLARLDQSYDIGELFR